MLIYRFHRARRNMGSLLRKVSHGESVTILCRGKPAVIMMSVDAYRHALLQAASPSASQHDSPQSPSMASAAGVSPDLFMAEFRLTVEQLAAFAKVDQAIVVRSPHDPTLQTFMRDCQRVVAMVQEISGRPRAYGVNWLRDEPVQTFRGSTALELVSQGRVGTVITYLDSIASGCVG